jgi:hypothetical protein
VLALARSSQMLRRQLRMTATMAMSAETRAGICQSFAGNVACSVNGSIKPLARIIKLARVMRIHLRLIQARKSPSSNEDSPPGDGTAGTT